MSQQVDTPARKKLQIPPSPSKKHWLLGNMYYLIYWPIQFLEENSVSMKGIYHVTSRFINMIVVDDPEYIKYILQDNNKNYLKWFNNDVLQLILGKGLLTSEGDFWRRQRRLSQPAFHKERIALMTKTMNDCIADLVTRLEQYDEKDTVDISKEMMAVTLRIVSGAMFSSNVEDAITIVGHEIEVLNQMAIDRFSNPLRLPISIPTPKNLEERRSVAKLDAVLKPIIQGRRKSTEHYDDLLSMLMETKDEDTGEQMSDQQLRDETITIFLAGHETTSIALTWLWFLLDKNPAEAQKLYDEIDTVLQGRTPQMQDIAQLVYTRQVIDETLRLYPPAWVIGRTNIEPDQIGGYFIPKNYVLLIPVYTVHHNPAIWPEPYKFNPDRFKKETIKDKHRFAYFPFGGGPRQCIGNNFALTEMTLVIASLLQKFRFKLAEGFEPELTPQVTLRMKGGMKVHIQKRH